ncbi:hypothetical protein C8Q80DRAFT_1233522 [Daedaleopsis nitida]|nr:hypothetical protein C8Q80DRAFT_1233522 [Daedaleopsis nitida]
MTKRKLESTTTSNQGAAPKRARTQAATHAATSGEGKEGGKSLEKKKREVQPRVNAKRDDERNKAAHKIRKMDPPRPFPTVPASVSATGPRSAHTEGKNYICITRRTELAAYLRRCKDVILKDGYKTLHLSAMGAAIPHLMQLALSLPPILPYAQDEIRVEVLTGTVEVQDELVPADEDEDIVYRSRGKSSLSVMIRVANGDDEGVTGRTGRGGGKQNRFGRPVTGRGGELSSPEKTGKGPKEDGSRSLYERTSWSRRDCKSYNSAVAGLYLPVC